MPTIDNMSWHLGGGSFPEDLPEENAATHIGFFVGWAIRRGLWKTAADDPDRQAIEAVVAEQMSGRHFVVQVCDGKLLSQMLTTEGASFARKGYDTYVRDYRRLLVQEKDGDYQVEDSPEHQLTMDAALDWHFEQWRNRPWWRFW